MRVLLRVLGGEPVGQARTVLAALPAPYAGGEVRQVDLPVEGCYDRQRAQLDAYRLLEQMETPPDGCVSLAITGTDMFLTPLAYVFGLAVLGGRRAVVSWARLFPESSSPDSRGVLLRRLTIEAVHELGHGLGLVHCVVQDCAMHRSLFAEAVDLKQPRYCPSCEQSLHAALTR